MIPDRAPGDEELPLIDENFLFALGVKSPAANSESTLPLTKREHPGAKTSGVMPGGFWPR